MKINRILYLLCFLFISIMNANAQTYSLSQLQGKIWHAKSGYSYEPLLFWDISFNDKQCLYKYRPKEITKQCPQEVTKRIDYYLCSTIPLKYDEKQSSTKGSYIVFKQRLNYEGHQREVFWYAKIKSINSSTLILETEEGTTTFESI